ncbi:MAG: PQQ-binding-like beta-propeller repeat protein [archaeon]|nr:PQQ-binding-like beta-propeller repeat protein [archaeon]
MKLYSSTGTFYAIDCDDGEIIWEKEISEIENTVCVYNEKVYVGAGDHIYCLNKYSGEIETDMNISGDVSTSLLIVDDTIFVGSNDTKMYALSLDGFTNGYIPLVMQ